MIVNSINTQTTQNSEAKSSEKEAQTEEQSIFESNNVPFMAKLGAYAAKDLKEDGPKPAYEIVADFAQDYSKSMKEIVPDFTQEYDSQIVEKPAEAGKKIGEFIKGLFK